MLLEGGCAVITGASGNLGREVVEVFVQEGARVAAVAGSERGLSALLSVAAAHPGNCAAMRADVTTADGVDELRAAVLDFLGPPDILVNLAGGFHGGADLWETSPDDWRAMMDLNLTSVFLCCRAFIPDMLTHGYGRIVNVSSRAAFSVRAGQAAYTVSKAAVATLTEALRAELKGAGVSVAAVAPNVIDGPAMREAMPNVDPGKWVAPHDLARIILLLCTEEGGLVSGGVLPVYGGM